MTTRVSSALKCTTHCFHGWMRRRIYFSVDRWRTLRFDPGQCSCNHPDKPKRLQNPPKNSILIQLSEVKDLILGGTQWIARRFVIVIFLKQQIAMNYKKPQKLLICLFLTQFPLASELQWTIDMSNGLTLTSIIDTAVQFNYHRTAMNLIDELWQCFLARHFSEIKPNNRIYLLWPKSFWCT